MSDREADTTQSQAPVDGTARPKRNARSAARIGAVQALYQMDLAGTDVSDVIKEFTTIRFPAAEEDDMIALLYDSFVMSH